MGRRIVILYSVVLTIFLMSACDRDSGTNPPAEETQTFDISGSIVFYNEYFTQLDVSEIMETSVILAGEGIEKSAVMDSLGQYVFQNVPNGVYIVSAALPERFECIPQTMIVTVAGTSVSVPVFAAMYRRRYSIIGRVTDEENNPVENVFLTLYRDKREILSSSVGSKTNKYGVFNTYYFGAIPSSDTTLYRFIPTYPGSAYIFSPDTAYVRLGPEPAICYFTVSYSGLPLYSIQGRVITDEGEGKARFPLNLSCDLKKKENMYNKPMIEFTDEAGAFLFNNITDGTYYLWTYNYKYGFPPFEVEVVGKDVIVPDINYSYIGPTKYSFYGRAVDVYGAGISDVVIKIGMQPELYTTNEDGIFSSLATSSYLFTVSIDDAPKQLLVTPSKSGYIFQPDTTWVTVAWKHGVELEEIVVNDFVGTEYLAEDYFPLGTGSSWAYERTIDSQEPSDQTVSVTGTETINEKTYTVMSSGYSDYFSVFRIENNTVYTHAENEDKEYLKFGVDRGSKWAITSIRGKILSATFIDTETVSVPAGTYEDCLHFELNLPLGETSYEKTDLWYARNVGLVRAEKVVVSMGEVMETVTDELIKF
ncbi:MAG: hypothetical protein HOC71_06920 [Candidatus Latescibacteria bacterium]|jgi:hypothetical protein|nr:hypothetical protein [Candidatus Latescibacterota bacterium]